MGYSVESLTFVNSVYFFLRPRMLNLKFKLLMLAGVEVDLIKTRNWRQRVRMRNRLLPTRCLFFFLFLLFFILAVIPFSYQFKPLRYLFDLSEDSFSPLFLLRADLAKHFTHNLHPKLFVAIPDCCRHFVYKKIESAVIQKGKITQYRFLRKEYIWERLNFLVEVLEVVLPTEDEGPHFITFLVIVYENSIHWRLLF